MTLVCYERKDKYYSNFFDDSNVGDVHHIGVCQ